MACPSSQEPPTQQNMVTHGEQLWYQRLTPPVGLGPPMFHDGQALDGPLNLHLPHLHSGQAGTSIEC